MRKPVSPGERRKQNELRRSALKKASVFNKKLTDLRAKEVKKVLLKCLDYGDPVQWEAVINADISCSYMREWLTGLAQTTGGPTANETIRLLTGDKVSRVWESQLRDYAWNRSGNLIVSVSGTLKEDLCNLLTIELENDANASNYQLVKNIMKQFGNLEQWQVLRITQTETMMALGEAGHIAAESLAVQFTKQWAISGLSNVRDSHLAMDGVTVDQYEPFIVGDESYPMQYPHEVGAPAKEVINCACACIRRPK